MNEIVLQTANKSPTLPWRSSGLCELRKNEFADWRETI